MFEWKENIYAVVFFLHVIIRLLKFAWNKAFYLCEKFRFVGERFFQWNCVLPKQYLIKLSTHNSRFNQFNIEIEWAKNEWIMEV